MHVKVAAFDAKDFDRSSVTEIPNEVDPTAPPRKVFKGFFSPLGVGVIFRNADLFETAYIEAVERLSTDFDVRTHLPFYCSSHLKRELGLKKAIPFCNRLVHEVQDYVELAHMTYVVLPPSKCPTVAVGGNRCPELPMKSEEFMRSLGPMFSYISAWNFLRKRTEGGYQILLDGFRSKQTLAWDELAARCTPTIYSHGDECNPFISLADILSFLTDVKLYQSPIGPLEDHLRFRGLRPDNVKRVWEDYSFDVDCWYLDESVLSKYKWNSNDLIDVVPHLARPVVFILADEIEKFSAGAEAVPPEQSTLNVVPTEPKKKFHRVLQRLPPYEAAVAYAYSKGGCVQFFDKYVDSDKIRDGDVVVYMGDNSKRIAKTLEDGFGIEVIKARDLRSKIEKHDS